MDPYGNPNRLAIGSACGGGAEHSGQIGMETKNDQTYFVDCLNVSCNSNDCSSYFDIPDCVTDVYLQALDGGDESFAALRQISDVFGQKDKKEYDKNCNHNVNPEPLPNEGCGCTGSYNGGAGAGTATCSGCDDGRPYETGFNDKKRDNACCGCPNDAYRPEVVNVKVNSTSDWGTGCSCGHAGRSCTCQDTYQQELVNKKPECTVEYKYVAEMPPPKPYCEKNDPSCCGNMCCAPPDTYELVKNTDAQRYQGKGPDRSNFYADDSCGCQNTSNNNLNVIEWNNDLNWAELRKSSYSSTSSNCCTCRSPSPVRRQAAISWVNHLAQTTDSRSSRSRRRSSSVAFSDDYSGDFPEPHDFKGPLTVATRSPSAGSNIRRVPQPIIVKAKEERRSQAVERCRVC